MNEEIVQTLKDLLLKEPVDVYNEDQDIKISNIELVDTRTVNGEQSRDIGSANLFLASAFLSTVMGVDLPTKNSEELAKSKKAWDTALTALKEENFIRQRPDTVRESFKLV